MKNCRDVFLTFCFEGDAAMIREWVLHECRPDISALPVDVSEKIKQLMQLCWHSNPNERPTFEGMILITNSR